MEKCKIVLMCLMLGVLSACASQRPANMSPEEEASYLEAEGQRAKEMLSETSPRNMNQQPKAVPEFRASIPNWRPPCPSE